MTTVLVTVGRMPKGLDVARGFAAAGCRVVVADPFAWHISRLSRAVAASVTVPAPAEDPAGFADAIVETVRRERVDLVVPISEETMHVVLLRDRLPAATRIFSGPGPLVHALHDKARFNRLARSFGLTVPDSAPLGSDDAPALVAERPVVVKPIWSCGGLGVRFVARGAPLPAPDAAEPALVQQRIDGRHLSTCSVTRDGRVLGTTVYQGTVMSGSVAVAFRRVTDASAIERWVAQFVEATRYTGFISFDFIVAEDGTPYAIECNPRVTSGMHFFDHPSVARAALGQDVPTIPHRPEPLLQHFYATLMEAEGAMLKGRPSREAWRNLAAAKDVVWSPRDPVPFWMMTPVSYQIIAKSLFTSMSMGEAATRDIGWFGPPPAGAAEVPEFPAAGAPLAVAAG